LRISGGWPSAPPKDWPVNRRRHDTARGEHLGNQTHATQATHSGANSSASNSTDGDDEEDECDQEDQEDECDENAEEEDDEPAAGEGEAAEKPGAKDKEKEAQERTEPEASQSRIKALEDRVNSLERENQAKEHQDAHNLVVGQDKTAHPQDGEEEPQNVGDSYRSGRRDSDSPAQGSREVGNQSEEEGEKTKAAEEARWNLEAFQKICGTDKMPMPQKTRERIRRDFHLFDADHNDMLDLSELKVFAPYSSVMILCLYVHDLHTCACTCMTCICLRINVHARRKAS
jgi:hypothetical protein